MFNFLGKQRLFTAKSTLSQLLSYDYLSPLRQWLNSLEIRDESMAQALCRLIPSQCPFERNIFFFGRKVGYIPPLCKLNPLYEEVVALRFRALCYLADERDERGQDIRCYS